MPRRYVLRLTGLKHVQLFYAKLLFKVGAQLCHATLQQKVEVGSTLFFEQLFPDKDGRSEKKVGRQFCNPVFALDKDGP
jgi:hypothetical protein